MQVEVRYVAQLKQAAGVASERVDLRGGTALRDLLTRLAELHGEALRGLLLGDDGSPQPTVLVFVGDVQADQPDKTSLKDGDVVTFLSPIAGG